MVRLSETEFRSLLRLHRTFEPDPVILISEPPEGEEIGLSDCRSQMAERRIEAATLPGFYLDRGTTGVGKSTADTVAFKAGKRGLSIQPTHENCAEVVKALRAAGIDAAAYPDRVTDGDQPNCVNPEADNVERIGLPVQQTICFCCRQKAQCETDGFLAQFKVAADADVAVATHARATRSGLDKLAEGRDLISIHENVIGVLLHQITVEAAALETARSVLDRLLNDPRYLDQFGTAYATTACGHDEVDEAKTELRTRQFEFVNHLANICDLLIQSAAQCSGHREISIPNPMPLPGGIHHLLFRICKDMNVQFGNQPVWQLLIETATGAFDREGVLINDDTVLTDDCWPGDLPDSHQPSEKF